MTAVALRLVVDEPTLLGIAGQPLCGDTSQGPDVRHHIPCFVVGHCPHARHAGPGYAILNDVEETLVIGGTPQLGTPEVGSYAAPALHPMATGALPFEQAFAAGWVGRF